MSQIKNRKIILAIIFLILSFFAFGCGKKTPVENVTFNIGENQIVMFKGQSLDISNFISVLPIDADDKSFSLSSSNSSVVSVVGARITANAQGSAIIRVVSNSDSLKEDVMTVRVENEQTKLNAPDNLLYDSQLQSFVFSLLKVFLENFFFYLHFHQRKAFLGSVFSFN